MVRGGGPPVDVVGLSSGAQECDGPKVCLNIKEGSGRTEWEEGGVYI